MQKTKLLFVRTPRKVIQPSGFMIEAIPNERCFVGWGSSSHAANHEGADIDLGKYAGRNIIP